MKTDALAQTATASFNGGVHTIKDIVNGWKKLLNKKMEQKRYTPLCSILAFLLSTH